MLYNEQLLEFSIITQHTTKILERPGALLANESFVLPTVMDDEDIGIFWAQGSRRAWQHMCIQWAAEQERDPSLEIPVLMSANLPASGSLQKH